ncbi:acetylserotonin O-methyltransferase [Nonomuraea sediminis]|uniref:acetylserotonin O-methyltransferase n=1 Tax=Nonomuraea sediminis TaxID=2835864 RepID=UPI002029CB37|nr:acetylserotonin O-methyltransferase [Nonomuraea sediminis]
MADIDLVRLARSYFAAKVLLSAVELDLFSALGTEALSEPEIRERLDLHPRASRDWLDSLTGLGLLVRDGGRYANSRDAAVYLDSTKDTYIGGFFLLLNFHYNNWQSLSNLLRTGEPGFKGAANFAMLYAEPSRVEQFMSAMDGAAAAVGPALAQAFDWSAYRSFVDVGGARGNLAADIVRAHPHLSGITFDLPQVEPAFQEHMDKLGLKDSISFRGGDFFTDPLPQADVAVFGHVLHDWDEEQRMALLKKAYDALPPGGQVVIYDALKEEAPGSPETFLMSLNMRLITSGGSEYTETECRSWLTTAGFDQIELAPLSGPDVMITARKGGR